MNTATGPQPLSHAVGDIQPFRRDNARRETIRRVPPPSLSAGMRTPPGFLVDEIAREEWERVAYALSAAAPMSQAKSSLLAGYCIAVACAVRAEQILAAEGRYYETRTKRGSVMRRRHPAALDAEQGWTSARRLAKELGLTGDCQGEQPAAADRRRSLFK